MIASSAPVASARLWSVCSTSLVCSRTSAMLKVLRLSTSTLPLRSNSTPRGAGSGSRRRWFSSAIWLNFWCCTIWNTQNATASAEKSTAMMYWSEVSRTVRLRRSSDIITGVAGITRFLPPEGGSHPPSRYGGQARSQFRQRSFANCVASGLSRKNPILISAPPGSAPLQSAGKPLDHEECREPDYSVDGRLGQDRPVSQPQGPNLNQGGQPLIADLVQHARGHEHDEPGQRLRDDELCAEEPREKPDNRLRQAANPDDPASQGILGQPAGRPRHHPGHGTKDERRVHHRHDHEVHHARTAHGQPRQAGLHGQRQDERQQHSDGFHRGCPPGSLAP